MSLEGLRELYEQLKARYDARELTVDQVRQRLLESRLQDSRGRYWTIDVESGNWIVNAGGAWIEGTPPADLSAGEGAPGPEEAHWMEELRSFEPTESLPEDVPLPDAPPEPPAEGARRRGVSSRSMVWILILLFLLLVLVFCALGAVMTNGYGLVDLGLW
jgi:hypothetical protein